MRSKYGAVATTYNGRRYHSKREAQYAAELDQLKKARGRDRVVAWRGQVRVPLLANGGAWVCDWVVDFCVQYTDGRIEYHEVKGYETPEFKLKLRLFTAQYPDEIVRIIK